MELVFYGARARARWFCHHDSKSSVACMVWSLRTDVAFIWVDDTPETPAGEAEGDGAGAAGGATLVLAEGEAILSLACVAPPHYAKAATGNGVEEDTVTPFMKKGTVFSVVGKKNSLDAAVGALTAYLPQYREANSAPTNKEGVPITWPAEFYLPEMTVQAKLLTEAWSTAMRYAVLSMLPDEQGPCNSRTMKICKRHFQHLKGVLEHVLGFSTFQDPDSAYWFGAWYLEAVMQDLADMHKEAAGRLHLPERLTLALEAKNITAICLGCGKPAVLSFSGRWCVEGKEHTCRPGANKVEEHHQHAAQQKEAAAGGGSGGVGGGGAGAGGGTKGQRRAKPMPPQFPSKYDAIVRALRDGPSRRLTSIPADASHMYAPSDGVASSPINLEDVRATLKSIEDKPENERSLEDQEVFELDKNGSLKNLGSWMHRPLLVNAFHSSRDGGFLLIVEQKEEAVGGGSGGGTGGEGDVGTDGGAGEVGVGGDEGAGAGGTDGSCGVASTHALFVSDDVAKYANVRANASQLTRAKGVYAALEMLDARNAREGYSLAFLSSDNDIEVIGCALMPPAERSAGVHSTADKAFHRKCLKAAATSFRTANE